MGDARSRLGLFLALPKRGDNIKFALFGVIAFLVLVLAAGGAFIFLASKPRKKKSKEQEIKANFQSHHVDNVINIEKIEDGLIYRNDKVMAMSRIEGTNFSVMSPGEQDARESALIEIFSRLDYPVQFITNTIVADTLGAAKRIVDESIQIPDGNLKHYMLLYANALEQMRVERLVLTQQSYLVVSSDGHDGDPEKTVIDRVRILESSLRERTGIVLTPLTITEDIYDVLQHIILPEKITKPSDVSKDGVTEPIHFSTRELLDIVQPS